MHEEPREEPAAVRRRDLILALAACALATACGRAAPQPGPAAARAPSPAPAAAPLTGYLAPPELIQADRKGDGVLLSGTATPGANLRLASPNGAVITIQADARGMWRLAAPVGRAPRLYSLSEQVDGRLVRATGYIVALPAPGPAAAMLHPAASATLTPDDPSHGLTAVDFDASGQAMASGRAAGGESIRLLLDGKEAGEDRADAAGMFSAALSQSLKPGAHVLVLAERPAYSETFTAARITQIATPPFASVRLQGAWRIDWPTPGGGVQSTVLFDQKGVRP